MGGGGVRRGEGGGCSQPETADTAGFLGSVGCRSLTRHRLNREGGVCKGGGGGGMG